MGKKKTEGPPRLSKTTADKLVRMYVGAKVPLETISRCENLDWYEGRMGDIAVRVCNHTEAFRGLYRIDINLFAGSGGSTMLIDPVTLKRDVITEDDVWMEFRQAAVEEWMDEVGPTMAQQAVDARFKREVACG